MLILLDCSDYLRFVDKHGSVIMNIPDCMVDILKLKLIFNRHLLLLKSRLILPRLIKSHFSLQYAKSAEMFTNF